LIPVVQIIFLSGNDGVEKWKDKKIWNAILKNVRIVVSTPQILLDALSNGFVDMDTLSLLVFDEAHNCVKSNPGSRIMRDFYQRRKAQRLTVPSILGLSASPIMNSRLKSLESIEATLDSICKTPVKKRAEFLQHVKMPELRQVLYIHGMIEFEPRAYTSSVISLHIIFNNLDINEDPYIKRLKSEKSERSERALESSLQKKNTWCYKQMKTFCDTSLVICRELGIWAAEYYIAQVVAKYGQLVDTSTDYLETWSDEEKRYLSKILKKIKITPMASETPLASLAISDKVRQFISALPQDGDSTVIVFAQQRATVAVLAHLLSVHPLTSKLRIGTMVGTSNSSQRKASVCDLIDLKDQRHTLPKFRAKELDLVIATSVLEEGIDIPACNTVICFDQPANLKSFVQRRGRARKNDSQLILMQASQSNKLELWQELEAQMKRIYADDMRSLRELNETEDLEKHDGLEFRIESTGCVSSINSQTTM
jgi:ERCC4-related helicase